MSAALVYLVCPACSNRVGVLEGSAGWCWGRGFIGHRRRRMREVTP